MTRRWNSEFPRFTSVSRTLLKPINRPLSLTIKGEETILKTSFGERNWRLLLGAVFGSFFSFFFLVLFQLCVTNYFSRAGLKP